MANGGAGNVKRLSRGGVAGSRLGFHGSEDVGSGLRASFVLEHDFYGDLGTPATAIFWNRQTFVGLGSATLGTFSMGRQYTPYFTMIASTDPAGFAMSSALNYYNSPGFAVAPGRPVGGISGTQGDSITRRSNSLLYTSPVLSDVQLKLFASAAEGTDARVVGGSMGYNTSTLFVNGSAMSERTTYVTGNTDKFSALSVGYDFGVVKPVAVIVRRRGQAAVSPEIDAYQIGASVPIGAGALIGTYAKLKNKKDDSFSSSGYGLRYDYFLSKRTRLYAGYTAVSNNANASFTISGGGSSSPGQALSAPGADPRSAYFGLAQTF